MADLAKLHRLDTNLTRDVQFWVNAAIEGYIIEFVAEDHKSFSKRESIFKFGLRGRLLKDIPLWIKVLLVEEKSLSFQEDRMVA